MSSWDDVRRLALSLPETSEVSDHGHIKGLGWKVKDKVFVWERPLGQSDLRALSALRREIPGGEILGARVEHEGAKLALIDSEPEIYFTIPHFDGFTAVLVRLERIGVEELEELIVDAWLVRAPKRLADAYLAAHRGEPGAA
ncbi:MAG: MmcQ/YjbR family DNA-binding protein [Acidobacteriota bacterium]|nr:MmcQ/YjbR family DNA-binding protein [Acidobacteriota bacterium]